MGTRAALSRTASAASATAATEVVRHDDTRLVPDPGVVIASVYGVVGDGSTDNLAALNAAIAAVPATGGILLLPAGEVRYNGNLALKPRLTVQGVADPGATLSGGTTLRQMSTTANGLSGVDITSLTVRDLTVQGPVSGSGVGVALTRSALPATVGVRFERVTVRDFGSHGIELSNPITSTFEQSTARACGGHGWYIHGVPGGSAGTSCSFRACYGNGNQLAGFRVEQMVYTGFDACAADSNGWGYEVTGSGCQGINFRACGVESSRNKTTGYEGGGWKISGGAAGVGLENCWVYDHVYRAVHVTSGAYAVTILGFAENTPAAAATHSIMVDTGCSATLTDFSVVRPTSLSIRTNILNDGAGGSTFAAGVYGAAGAYFVGEVATETTADPSWDGALTRRGWVNTRLADRVPISRVHGGGEWDRQVYGDVVGNGHRDDAAATFAMSATIRTLTLLVGRVPAGEAITGFRMARSVAAVAGAASAALFSSSSLTATSWARAGAGNVAPVLTGTGVVATPLAVGAQPSDLWYVLQFVLTTAPTTYPTWLATPAISVSGFAAQGIGSITVAGSSSGVTAPAATLNPTTGFTLLGQKPWVSLY